MVELASGGIPTHGALFLVSQKRRTLDTDKFVLVQQVVVYLASVFELAHGVHAGSSNLMSIFKYRRPNGLFVSS